MNATCDATEAKTKAAEMGKVFVDMGIFNAYDEERVLNGMLKPEQIPECPRCPANSPWKDWTWPSIRCGSV